MVLSEAFLTLILLTIFFFLLSALPFSWRKKICLVCASVSLTWLTLLIFFYLGIFREKLILAILMGGTVVGLFNLLKEKLKIFKFPFTVTLFFLVYALLQWQVDWKLWSFLLILWLIFFLFSDKYKRFFAKTVDKLLSCCRDW